jgi:hypothetical protein
MPLVDEPVQEAAGMWHEKKMRNYQGLAEFACAVIIWRNRLSVHPGLIPG